MSRLRVLDTYHTSSRAFWTKDPIERDRRKKDLADKFIQAGKILQIETPSVFNTLPDLSTSHHTTYEVTGTSAIQVDTIRNEKNRGEVFGFHEGQKNQNISEGVRKSWEDPEIRKKRMQKNAVKVHRHGTFIGDFTSLRQAFKVLGLPDSKHIPFRIKLKQAGKQSFSYGNDIYDFEIIPPL